MVLVSVVLHLFHLMPIKKSQIYSSLWSACDELRGGMDASQYKDYILTLLFIKYISDLHKTGRRSLIVVPRGASFDDMYAIRHEDDLGDKMNKMVEKITSANAGIGNINVADFDDGNKLGDAREKKEKLARLLAIFSRPELDLTSNRVDGDDILGDAYEYLMKNFATESGKSKGQFYTPAEVSRLIAAVIGMSKRPAGGESLVTLYDPACGSGSLLLRAAEASPVKVSIHGQEKDGSTAGLARMNMVLHGQDTAVIHDGNTLANPRFKDGDVLRTFDYVVANPPFSQKNWMTGFEPSADLYHRFEDGIPPEKNGDYAFLLHIIKSMKPKTGKGACILPHGILFRGNAEADIRRNLIKRRIIKAIISLPPNLFYGTSIPACIIVLDKENAAARDGIFMIDASKGFIKDGAKNRLREQDIQKAMDVFHDCQEIPGYSRMVPLAEIDANDYNLNLPRYIDSSNDEVRQDLFAHLNGGIPDDGLRELDDYWQVFPQLRTQLFSPSVHAGYSVLNVPSGNIRSLILESPEFQQFRTAVENRLSRWMQQSRELMMALHVGVHAKDFIRTLGDLLRELFHDMHLVDEYDVYQRLMDYWEEPMRDDVYLIAAEGWIFKTSNLTKTDKKGKEKITGWESPLLPETLLQQHFFPNEVEELHQKRLQAEQIQTELDSQEEEQLGEDGFFFEWEKVDLAALKSRIKDIKGDLLAAEELAFLHDFLARKTSVKELKSDIKTLEMKLSLRTRQACDALTEEEGKMIVVDQKWLASLRSSIHEDVERVMHTFAQQVKTLADRYATPLPKIEQKVAELKDRITAHLQKMGLTWEGIQK